jgi:WD40 repeat protein
MYTCVRSLTSHTQSVTCIRWSGKDLIYSASQDRTIKVWRAEDVGTFHFFTLILKIY